MRKDTVRIAIAGPDESGKTTLAQSLGLQKVAFADPLREFCVSRNLLTPAQAYSKQKTPAIRGTLRKTGEMLKSIWGDNYFVQEFAKTHGYRGNVVVDDLRFLCEATWCQNQGYTLVYLDKSLPDGWESLPSFRDLPEIRRRADIILSEKPDSSSAKEKIWSNPRLIPRHLQELAFERDRDLFKFAFAHIQTPFYLTEEWEYAEKIMCQLYELSRRKKIQYIVGISASNQMLAFLTIILLAVSDAHAAEIAAAGIQCD